MMQIENKALRAAALQAGDDLEKARAGIEADIQARMADDPPAALERGLGDLIQ